MVEIMTNILIALDEFMRLPITPLTLMASFFLSGICYVWFYGFLIVVDRVWMKIIKGGKNV